MPLFFVLSGYLFNPKGFVAISFFKNVFFRLVIPWLAFGLLLSLMHLPIYGFDYFMNDIMDLLSGKDLWFMPAFIIGQTIFFFLIKYSRRCIILLMSCILLGIFGLIASHIHILRYAMVDVALSSQLFFIMGYLIKKHKGVLNLPKSIIAALIGVYVLLCCLTFIVWPGESLDVHMGHYYNYVVSFSMIVVGIISIMNILKRVSAIPNWISTFGQHTLVIYILHAFFAGIVSKLFAKFGLPTVDHLFFAITATLFSISVCTYISILVSKYLPLLNGTKRIH